MGIGEMNCFADIVSRTIGIDSEGFRQETETTVAHNVRCYHEVRHPSRRWNNLAAFSEATDRFVIRFIPGVEIETGFFVDFEGKRCKIVSVENVRGRGMYLEIYAERTVGALG